MKMKILAMFLIFLVAFAFAYEPTPEMVKGVAASQAVFNKSLLQKSTAFTVGAVTTDTVTTNVVLSKYAVLGGVYITVSDTVESRGDSALVKILVGSTEIFSQMTSAFKLGVSTAPRTFYFAPTVIYTPLAGGAVSYRVTQSKKTGAVEGITEGSFKVNFNLFYP